MSVGLPEPHPTLGYQCTATIEGFSQHGSTTFSATEGWVALTYTLNMLPEAVEYLVRAEGGGRITPVLRTFADDDVLEVAEVVRELEYLAPRASASVPIKVVISLPLRTGTKWSCMLSIKGFADEHVMPVHHADSIGAITEALYRAPNVLQQLVEPGGRLTYLGSEDLGFPVRPGG
jgi:hypothetical protein